MSTSGQDWSLRGTAPSSEKWTLASAACFSLKDWDKWKPAQPRGSDTVVKLECQPLWMGDTGDQGWGTALLPKPRLFVQMEKAQILMPHYAVLQSTGTRWVWVTRTRTAGSVLVLWITFLAVAGLPHCRWLMAHLALSLMCPLLESAAGLQPRLSYCLLPVLWLLPRPDTVKRLRTENWKTKMRNLGLKCSIVKMDAALFTWLSHHGLQIIHLHCASLADSCAELRINRWITSQPEYSHENHTWRKKHILAQSYINWNFHVIYVFLQIHTYTSKK